MFRVAGGLEPTCVSVGLVRFRPLPPNRRFLLRFQKTIFSALERDPLFARPGGRELSMEKHQELTFLRCKRVFEFGSLLVGRRLQSPLTALALLDCLGAYDWSLAIKVFLHLFVSGRQGEDSRGLPSRLTQALRRQGAGPSRGQGCHSTGTLLQKIPIHAACGIETGALV